MKLKKKKNQCTALELVLCLQSKELNCCCFFFFLLYSFSRQGFDIEQLPRSALLWIHSLPAAKSGGNWRGVGIC